MYHDAAWWLARKEVTKERHYSLDITYVTLFTLAVNNKLEEFFKIFTAVCNHSINKMTDFDIVHCALSYRTKL